MHTSQKLCNWAQLRPLVVPNLFFFLRPCLILFHMLYPARPEYSLNPQYSNVPLSSLLFISVCFQQWGGSLQPVKDQIVILLLQPKAKEKKGYWSSLRGVVCFSYSLCTLLQILASFNEVLISEREWFNRIYSPKLTLGPSIQKFFVHTAAGCWSLLKAIKAQTKI